jgi:hypothetical protein
MPYKRLTHEQCRFRVCFVCGNEEGKRNQLCGIGMGDAKLIKEHILSDFTTLDSRYRPQTFPPVCSGFRPSSATPAGGGSGRLTT